MIDKKYFKELYKIIPLNVAADLGEMWVEAALIEHKFKLEQDHKYTLVLGRYNISELLKINSGYKLFDITVELQEDLKDEWYLVCEQTKTIVYSPGA